MALKIYTQVHKHLHTHATLTSSCMVCAPPPKYCSALTGGAVKSVFWCHSSLKATKPDTFQNGRSSLAMWTLTLYIFTLMLASPAPARAALNNTFSVTFATTNDMNSYVVPVGLNYGFPMLAGALQAAPPWSLLLDSGNFMGFSPFFSFYNGTVQASMMASLGYHLVGVGASDLFWGPDALAAFLTAASLTIVCSNCAVTGALAGLVVPYAVQTILDDNGQQRRLGVVGYAVETMCATSSCGAAPGTSIAVHATIPAVCWPRHVVPLLSVHDNFLRLVKLSRDATSAIRAHIGAMFHCVVIRLIYLLR